MGSSRPGHWEGREEWRRECMRKAQKRGVVVRQEMARALYADLVPLMTKLHRSGVSLEKIAERLNKDGHTTATQRWWYITQVRSVLVRFGVYRPWPKGRRGTKKKEAV